MLLENIANKQVREIGLLRDKVAEQREIINELRQFISELEDENIQLKRIVQTQVYQENEDDTLLREQLTP